MNHVGQSAGDLIKCGLVQSSKAAGNELLGDRRYLRNAYDGRDPETRAGKGWVGRIEDDVEVVPGLAQSGRNEHYEEVRVAARDFCEDENGTQRCPALVRKREARKDDVPGGSALLDVVLGVDILGRIVQPGPRRVVLQHREHLVVRPSLSEHDHVCLFSLVYRETAKMQLAVALGCGTDPN